MINRDDMLELTRRMTVKRNCFSRIAGAYFDEEGEIDGTVNRHFLRLKPSEQAENLEIAKAVPFAETNRELREYRFSETAGPRESMRMLLLGMIECGLKNDILMETFYEVLGREYLFKGTSAVYVLLGRYDVPLRGSDREDMYESEEVYDFIICTVCPVSGDYEPGKPEWGFLYPAFKNRSSEPGLMNIYEPGEAQESLKRLFGVKLTGK